MSQNQLPGDTPCDAEVASSGQGSEYTRLKVEQNGFADRLDVTLKRKKINDETLRFLS